MSHDGASALRLLLVGPLPPPPTGTGVSFQIFCREVERALPAAGLDVIDTSPKKLKRHFRSVSASTLTRAIRIGWAFARRVRRADRVVVFGTDGFLVTMAPILILLGRVAGRRLHLRVFGGSLDAFHEASGPIRRRILDWVLESAEGLSVQTRLLRDAFRPSLGDRVTMSPGYRYLEPSAPEPSRRASGSELRVLYVGLLFEDKGVFVLLEALRRLAAATGGSIHCDLFGKVYAFAQERLDRELARTEHAAYRGVLEPGTVVATMAEYDALVFPSFYRGEGHPGVVVESMMAGIPVVTTRHRSIPELVDDRVNGLLVPPRDAEALASALLVLQKDRELLAAMGQRNRERRARHDARRVVPELARRMGIPIDTPASR